MTMPHTNAHDLTAPAQRGHARLTDNSATLTSDSSPHADHAAVDARSAPYAALALRAALGIVFIAHALLKLFVFTLPGTAAFFAAHGFPGWTAYPVFALELVGGVALVAGVYARWVALGLIPVLLGAITVHWGNGWSFNAKDGGWEYVAFLIAALVVQAALGDGVLALRPTTASFLPRSQAPR